MVRIDYNGCAGEVERVFKCDAKADNYLYLFLFFQLFVGIRREIVLLF
jgi:hypothetical protein